MTKTQQLTWTKTIGDLYETFVGKHSATVGEEDNGTWLVEVYVHGRRFHCQYTRTLAEAKALAAEVVENVR